jgi:hypothetical protein
VFRRLIASLVAGFIAVTFLLAADDPPAEQPELPVRLKKKNRPIVETPPKEEPPAPKVDEPKGKQPEPKEKVGDEPPVPIDPDMDEQETLARVARNMKASEDRLANKELGEGVRLVQKDIVDDLDKLINKLNQPNSGGGGSSGASGGQKQQSGQQASSGGRRSQQKPGQGQSAQQKPGQGNSGQKPGQGSQQVSSKPGAGSNPGAGNGGPQGENKIPDIYKDIWGHLPESLRQEMMAYSREEYMAKYKDIIKQYYSTIAEKGRKKE